MENNISRMQKHVTSQGASLRPHLKTSKCIEIAEAMTRGHSRAVAVSTLREADYFGSHGFSDILYTVAPPPGKLPHVMDLLARGIRVMVLADNPQSVEAICDYGRSASIKIPVLLEIDCDGHRSGLSAAPEAVIPLARTLSRSNGASFAGIMTHAGGAYDCKSIISICQAAARECAVVDHLALQLAHAGMKCPVISVGSTPTAIFGEGFERVTEVRAGAFVFNDLTMVNLGVCDVPDIAISVLTSVIGHREQANQIVTDAGWTALSSDLSTEKQAKDFKYGLVCDGLTGAPLDDMLVVGTNQEHGLVGQRHGRRLDYQQFPVGRLLRVLPVHACATAAAHGSYRVTDGSTNILGEWKRVGGW